MPDNDIWTLFDQNLTGLRESGTMSVVAETPIPSAMDEIFAANLKAVERSMLPTIGPAKTHPDKLSILPENNQERTVTIGPYKGDIDKVQILPAEMEGQFLANMEARHQAETLGPLSPVARTVEAGLGAVSGAASSFFGGLQQASDEIGRVTGLKSKDLMERISKAFGDSAMLYNTMSRGAKDTETPLPYLVDFTARAAGGAAFDIGAMSLLGPFGMTLYTGFNGWKDAPEGEKLEGLVSGLITGAALQGTFHAIGGLPSIAQLPMLGITGTALGVMQGRSAQGAAEEGLTWAGLGLLGGKNLVTKEEFLSRYGEIGALNKLKATRFLKQFKVDDEGNIVNMGKPSLVRGDMSGLQDFYTRDIIEAAGGPEKLTKKISEMMAAEYRKMDAATKAIVEKKALTNESTPDIVRGEDGQAAGTQADIHPGVGPGVDPGLHGTDGSGPGRSDTAPVPGLAGDAGRVFPSGNRQASPVEYVAAFDAAMANHPHRLQATRPDPESLAGAKPILSPDGKSGVVITSDGELANVFNAPGGSMVSFERVFTEGIDQGGRWLNAYDTHLTTGYARAGYRPVARVKFNPEYAPEGWDYKQYDRWNSGRPDIIFMVHDGVQRSARDVRAEINALGYTSDYDVAAGMAKRADVDLRAEAEALQKRRWPSGTGREAKGLTDVEAKMGAIMRGEVKAAPAPASNEGKRGQVTVAPNLREVELITMDDRSLATVEKGQGKEIIKRLQEAYPEDRFGISDKAEMATGVDTAESLDVRASRRAQETERRRNLFADKRAKKSLLTVEEEGDVYADSEIFGDSSAADARALEAAKALEAQGGTAEPGAAVEATVPKAKPDPVTGGNLGIVAPGTAEVARAVEKFKTLFLDKFYPIHAVVDSLKKAGLSIDSIHDPSVLVRLLAGVPGIAEARIRFGFATRDANGHTQFTGESMGDAIAPFIRGKNLGRFNDYLVYRRALEIDANSKGAIKTGVDLVRAQQFVNQYSTEFAVGAEKFTKYFHRLLDELVDSGLMSKEVVDDLKVTNPRYAPMKRILEEMDRRGIPSVLKEALDEVGNPIKRLRGSELDIIPPTESAVLMTYEITSAAERNRAAQAIIELKDLSPEMARVITKAKPKIRFVRDLSTGLEVPTVADRQDPDVVAVSFEGHRQYWKVPQDIADAMKMIHETGLGSFVKFLAKPARLLRTGATLSPEFMMRNPMRDVLTAYMNSKVGFNPIIDFPRGFFTMVLPSKREAYWRWKASGGEWSMMAAMDRAMGSDTIKQMERESAGGWRKYAKSPLGYLEALSEFGEKPTRIGVFERARRKGMNDMQAAIESREASTDFHVRGSSDAVRTWGAVSTFFNARLQTSVKMMRTAKEEPLKFALKGFAAASIPSALLYYFNRDDPDYWKRSEIERDTFWFLPIEYKGRQIKIPKGEIGLIFGTPIEKLLQFLDEDAEYRPKLDEFLKNLIKNSLPIGNAGEILPVAVRPIMEWITNHSFYYDTPIVQDTLEKKARYLEDKPTTSETMKVLGKGLANMDPSGEGASPAKLENTLRGYTGGLGRLALKATDWAGDKLGLLKTGERPDDPVNIPGFSGLMSQKATGFESDPARAFYSVAENLEKYKTTIAELAKVRNAEEIKAWIKKHPTEQKLYAMGLSTQWSTNRRELATLRKAMNMIVENKDLSGKEKAKALDVLNQQVSAIVDPLWHLVNLLEKERGASLQKKAPSE